MSTKHIPQLDGLRAVAVILVLLAHATVAFDRVPLLALWVDRYGSLGVQIFFVLSGFLITRILLETKEKPRFFSSFFARRALRIYPLYYLVFAFVAYSGLVHQHGVHLWIYAVYLSNLSPQKGPQPAPFGPFWSLAVEEQFYLVWPFIVWTLSRRRLEQLSVTMILVAIALRCSGLLSVHHTLLQLDGLAAGAWLACRFGQANPLRRFAAPVACLLPLSFTPHALYLNALSQTVQVLSSAALLILLLDDSAYVSKLLSNPMLRYIGMISYGIYLLHSFVFAGFLRTTLAARVIASGSLLAAIACTSGEIALAIGVASISFYAFEQPFLRLKRFFPAGGAPRQGRQGAPGTRASTHPLYPPVLANPEH